METKAAIPKRANAMPAATWHFLNMNDTQVEIPRGLAIAPDVKIVSSDLAQGAADEFENALAEAQDEWERSHPMPTEAELAALSAYLESEADATYGGTARSAYQTEADAIEESRALSAAFGHGMGDEVAAYLRYAAKERVVIAAEPRQEIDAEVIVAASSGAMSVAAVDIIADIGSRVSVSLVVEDAELAMPDEASGRQGFAGTTLRVFADKGATVEIERVQTLSENATDFDDMGLFAAEGARVNVRQTALGAARSLAGLAGDLRGDASCIDVDLRYLGCRSQERDFNYSIRHHGEKTRCNLQANGVLAGESSKTLRGTIDLVRGCKGAEGSENETVLLVDESVHNKTVPVILCNEDDVMGNHGATIGHIRDEQLFYLASRGLSREAAERMFVGAIVEQAALDASSPVARASVVRLGERLTPGFADLFEEETR